MGSNSIKNIPSNLNLSKDEIKTINSIDASCHAETGLLKKMLRNLSKNNKKPKLNKYSLIVNRYDSKGNPLMQNLACVLSCYKNIRY